MNGLSDVNGERSMNIKRGCNRHDEGKGCRASEVDVVGLVPNTVASASSSSCLTPCYCPMIYMLQGAKVLMDLIYHFGPSNEGEAVSTPHDYSIGTTYPFSKLYRTFGV
jgi:hypothetical protein